MLDMHIGCCWFLALLKCFTIGLKVIIRSAMPVVTLCMQWLRTACAIERAAIGWTGRQKRASLAGLLHAPAFLAEHLLAKKKDLGQAASLMEEVLNARQQVLVSSCLAFRPSACCSSAHHLQLDVAHVVCPPQQCSCPPQPSIVHELRNCLQCQLFML